MKSFKKGKPITERGGKKGIPMVKKKGNASGRHEGFLRLGTEVSRKAFEIEEEKGLTPVSCRGKKRKERKRYYWRLEYRNL